MNLFIFLFFIGIGLYFIASIISLLFSRNKNSNIISMIISLAASAFMVIATIIESFINKFEQIEYTIFPEMYSPLEMSLKINTESTMFFLAVSVSYIIITIYMYTSTLSGDTRISYFKNSFLSNLLMIVLSLMIFSNQSYFLSLLIGCAIALIFAMLASDFKNKEAAKKATRYLIAGNISVVLLTIGYGLVLYGSGMLTINGFEASLVSYNLRNITFMMIMTSLVILLSVIPKTEYTHIRLMLNGLFSKVILFIMIRYVVNLYSGNISIICILILLAAGLIFTFYNSFKASVTINGTEWIRYVDLALNSLCFISIIFSMYADNLGYGLIAQQIRISTIIMILCSIVLYPAITILINNVNKIDKTKRFKLISILVFIPKALLPPVGGFAGIFIIITNISALLDAQHLLKTLFLIASLFGFIYVYIFYVYSHIKFFINVIDSGYEPETEHGHRKISKIDLTIIASSIFFTFITGVIPSLLGSELGFGIVLCFDIKTVLLLLGNVATLMALVYFLNSTQVNNTLEVFKPAQIRLAVRKEGYYHMLLKAASLLFLIIGGTFFSISPYLIVDSMKSYSILGIMYIILSVFLLYNKDIDFKDLYMELFIMLAIVIDTGVIQIKILMGILCLFMIGYAIFRQKSKIIDRYDRILANGRLYIYISFFLTLYGNFQLNLPAVWNYVIYVISGAILFIIIYIVSSIIYVKIFNRKKVVEK